MLFLASVPKRMLSIIISRDRKEYLNKMDLEENIINKEMKRCKKCGRVLPEDKFRLVKGQFNNPYY